MKRGLKIWRKLLLASLFLAGIATVSVAQNGAATANCGNSLITVTRTANQINAGTDITLNFSNSVTEIEPGHDKYYFVAASGGSLTGVTCLGTIGRNLEVVSVNGVDNTITGAESPIVAAGTFASGDNGQGIAPITVNVKAIAPQDVNAGGTYELGIFIYDESTGCYSDVNWVTIEVLGNIYASLTLNGADPFEYICHGGTTSTNIGFTLCNLPSNSNGTLNYKVTANTTTNITGYKIASSGNTGGEVSSSDVMNATITPIADGTVEITINETTYQYSRAYTVNIGQQTLNNINPSVAEQIVYGFTDMTYTYVDNGRTITLPIVFETPTARCNDRGIYDSTFTVYVAPNFDVQALAFKTTDDRTTHVTTHADLSGWVETEDGLLTPTFCQGTVGYFRAINSTTEGNIVYAWTGTPALDDNGSRTPTATVQFTNIDQGAYALDVVATWNKDSKFPGCIANDDMPITITPAPILLLATDKADMSDAGLADNAILWNTTDQITAPVVCPGNPILMATNDEKNGEGNYVVDFAADDAAARIQYMNDGNYIRANENTLNYTINPLDNDDLKAYTAWRSVAATNGTLPLTQTNHEGNALDPVEYGHFLNNQTTGQANIIYTVESAGECKLVKKDGSSLNNPGDANYGQVKIIFPVQPRPQFQLGAN